MSYTIVRTDGSILTVVPDGVVNTTSTPISLPGRNYSSYGVVMDTNFVHTLENFADTIPPSNPIRGQLWYNVTTNGLYVCPTDGETDPNNWIMLYSSTSSDINSGNLTLTGNIHANNASIDNELDANSIFTNYLTVNVSANIANATLSGTSNIANIKTTNITTGSNSTFGLLTGNLELDGNLNAITGTVSASAVKTDSYNWANGDPLSFATTSGSSTQIQYNMGGNLAASANLTFNPVTNNLTVNGNIVAAKVYGNVYGNGEGLTNLPAANIEGSLSSAVQGNIIQVGTLSSLTVSGNVNAGNIAASRLVSSVTTGTAPLNVVSTTRVANLNVANAGYSDNAGSATTATTAGTVTTSAQPNITSVGTVTGLTSSGNISAPYFIGNVVGNISGNLTVPGSNTQILFNDAGAAGASSGLTFNKNSGLLAVSGNIQSTRFIGSGANLTNIPAGNITGTVANASYATNAGSATTATSAGTVTTAAQPNITSVGTLTSLTVSGNINAGNVIATHYGNGAALTNIPAGNIVGTVPSATTATTAGTVTSSAQPNITSLGTLISLTSSGNITGANIIGNHYGNGTALANLTGANVIGTVASATIASTAGTVTSSAQPNITSVGTLISLTSSGNITGANIVGNHYGNGAALANINASNVVGSVSSASTAGTVTSAVQSNITSVGTLSSLTVAGNINAGNVIANHLGNGFGLTNIVAGNIVGTVANATAATTAGTVTTAAQPNITSVGILNSLAVSGNISGVNVNGTHYGSATGLADIPAANIVGTVSNASHAINSNSSVVAGTVTTASQPNITSVGTLTSLAVSGSLTKAGANVLTRSDFTESFGSTGWSMLPNGMIIQWGIVPNTGTETTTTSFFPITFPNACVAVMGLVTNSSGSSENDYWYQVVSASQSQVQLFHNSSDGGSQSSAGTYIAIGY